MTALLIVAAGPALMLGAVYVLRLHGRKVARRRSFDRHAESALRMLGALGGQR